jgi:hypothetical protein
LQLLAFLPTCGSVKDVVKSNLAPHGVEWGCERSLFSCTPLAPCFAPLQLPAPLSPYSSAHVFCPPLHRRKMPRQAADLEEALNKKGGLTLSQLANYDDLITDALVDRVRISIFNGTHD